MVYLLIENELPAFPFGRHNGAMLVLFDLSAAFDTIDHDNLFCIIEKYVGICGNALKLIKSYISNRTQRVHIDDVLADFANNICGVAQGLAISKVNSCRSDIRRWMNTNKLKINNSKT